MTSPGARTPAASLPEPVVERADELVERALTAFRAGRSVTLILRFDEPRLADLAHASAHAATSPPDKLLGDYLFSVFIAAQKADLVDEPGTGRRAP